MKRLVALLPVLIAFQAGAPPALAWTWPADGPVLQPFVLGDDPYAGGQHRGIDVASAGGAEVRSPAAGVVSFAGTVPGGGRTVTVQTADGYSVTLVHLGSFAVVREAPVAEGAPIGTVGPSGDVEHAEPYVHLGIRVTADSNGYVDPLSLLPERSETPVPPPEPPAEPAPVHPAPAPTADEPAAPAPAPKPGGPVADAPAGGDVAAAPRAAPAVPSVRVAVPRRRDARPPATVSPVAPGLPPRTQVRSFELPSGVAAAAGRPLAHVGDRPATAGSGTRALALAGAVGALLCLLGWLLALRVRQLVEARLADAPLAVLDDGAAGAAEDAGALGSVEEDRLVLDRDLERVALGQAEPLADLDRDDDPAQLVEVPNDPCSRLRGVTPGRFHRGGPRPPSRCRGVELLQAR
jgi:hypothetical protein